MLISLPFGPRTPPTAGKSTIQANDRQLQDTAVTTLRHRVGCHPSLLAGRRKVALQGPLQRLRRAGRPCRAGASHHHRYGVEVYRLLSVDAGCHARPVTVAHQVGRYPDQGAQEGTLVLGGSAPRTCAVLSSETSSVSENVSAEVTGLAPGCPEFGLSHSRSLTCTVVIYRLHFCSTVILHKKFTVATRLAFKAVATVSREVVTVPCQVCHDIATLASAEAELAEVAARKETRAHWKAWIAKAAASGKRSQAGSIVDQGNRRVGSTDRQRRGRIVVFRTRRRFAPALHIVARIVAGSPPVWSMTSTSELLALPPAGSFKAVTSVTDGFHPRQLQLSPVEALGELCKLLYAAEALGDRPCAQRSLIVAMLSKPTGKWEGRGRGKTPPPPERPFPHVSRWFRSFLFPLGEEQEEREERSSRRRKKSKGRR